MDADTTTLPATRPDGRPWDEVCFPAWIAPHMMKFVTAEATKYHLAGFAIEAFHPDHNGHPQVRVAATNGTSLAAALLPGTAPFSAQGPGKTVRQPPIWAFGRPALSVLKNALACDKKTYRPEDELVAPSLWLVGTAAGKRARIVRTRPGAQPFALREDGTLETSLTIDEIAVEPIDGTFPEIGRVIPEPGEGAQPVSFNAAVAGLACDLAKALPRSGWERAAARFVAPAAEGAPAMFAFPDAPSLLVVSMPLKSERFAAPWVELRRAPPVPVPPPAPDTAEEDPGQPEDEDDQEETVQAAEHERELADAA